MSVEDYLKGVEMNEGRFLSLLEKLIGETEHLQNNPSQGLIPREDAASDHVLALLAPYTKENGGVLEVERVTFVEGRGNVIIKYPGTSTKYCSFVGSHLDVVPADPSGWERDPFKLSVEGDMLYGRGTTDCLGHVALLTDLLITLAETKPALSPTVVVVFIANEENGTFPGIGVDQLDKEGYLEPLKAGPVFWIDSADSQPCVGTAGNIQWRLKAVGKLFHSGLPHKGINSIELAMDAVNLLQKRFYEDFPKHPQEAAYNYATPSTLKPCQIKCTPGALNQLPPECIVEGDIRLTPFYDIKVVRESVERYVAEMNENPAALCVFGSHGEHSQYVLEDKRGKIELTWLTEGENGVACNLTSVGYKALLEATESVLGSVAPYAIGGSLPLIRELQDSGYDVQISGYGFSSRYHADNEAVSLASLKQATKIMAGIIATMHSS